MLVLYIFYLIITQQMSPSSQIISLLDRGVSQDMSPNNFYLYFYFSLQFGFINRYLIQTQGILGIQLLIFDVWSLDKFKSDPKFYRLYLIHLLLLSLNLNNLNDISFNDYCNIDVPNVTYVVQ